jgi:hypothetical protein
VCGLHFLRDDRFYAMTGSTDMVGTMTDRFHIHRLPAPKGAQTCRRRWLRLEPGFGER